MLRAFYLIVLQGAAGNLPVLVLGDSPQAI
jgi:hypothetical protein